jgi:hypothetical protein
MGLQRKPCFPLPTTGYDVMLRNLMELLVRRCTSLLCSIIVSSCGSQDCAPLGFDEGERFRFTVLSRGQSADPQCVPLSPGDTFELVAGGTHGGSAICAVRKARGTIAPFGDIDFPHCDGANRNLGLAFWSTSEQVACRVSMQVQVATTIRRTDRTVEDGVIVVNWTNPDCAGGCQERFNVRIEILNQL